jgi:hypothetical protein
MKKYATIFLTSLLLGLYGCVTQEPSSVLTDYYTFGNNLVNGDTTKAVYLKTHLSKAATKSVEKLPFLFEYSLLSLTKKGTLESVEVIKTDKITQDSLVLHLRLLYQDKSHNDTHQSMVFEDKKWKVSISSK